MTKRDWADSGPFAVSPSTAPCAKLGGLAAWIETVRLRDRAAQVYAGCVSTCRTTEKRPESPMKSTQHDMNSTVVELLKQCAIQGYQESIVDRSRRLMFCLQGSFSGS